MIGVAGLGSAGLPLTIFEPYRPYLMGMTALFLSVGFYMAYRKQEESCGEDEACATPRSLKMRKVGLWTVTEVADSDSLVTTVLAIEGMT